MAKFKTFLVLGSIFMLSCSCTSAATIQEDDVGFDYYSPIDPMEILVMITGYESNTLWAGMLPDLIISEDLPKQYGVTEINSYENYRKLQRLDRWMYFCNHKC